MFDNYVFTKGSCKNVEKDGEIVGFQLKSLITYYRGIPCSMVNEVKVTVDQTEVKRDSIYFSPDGKDYFTLDELETVTTYKWEYGQEATIFVEKPGGLSKGSHEVDLFTSINTAYIPVPVGGNMTRKVVID